MIIDVGLIICDGNHKVLTILILSMCFMVLLAGSDTTVTWYSELFSAI
jgi:cytochrome P450